MKPGIGRQVEPGRGSETRGSVAKGPRVKPLPDLSAVELEVLEYLRQVGTGLTVGQLEARFPSSAPIHETLRLLMERGFVSRLNTIVPSYTCRRAGTGVHAE